MFQLFKKKSVLQLLTDEHKKCLEAAYKLSTINRTESDKKYKEANDIANKIDLLKNK